MRVGRIASLKNGGTNNNGFRNGVLHDSHLSCNYRATLCRRLWRFIESSGQLLHHRHLFQI